MNNCSIKDCNKKIYARGWCRQHYRHVVEGGHSEPLPVQGNLCQCGQKCSAKAGTSGLCRECYYKKWTNKNDNQRKEYCRQYRLKNKNKIREQAKQWHVNNKDCVKAYYAKKRADPIFRLAHNLRSRLYDHLKGNIKHKSTMSLVGCEIEDLKKHLEAQFEPNMTWDNYGKEWVVDHIVPLCSIESNDLSALEKVCHFSNLRPMWYNLNSSKATEDKKWKTLLQQKS